MPTISAQEHAKSKKFIDLMGELMGTIDDIAELIPEGKYLEMCDKIKKLHTAVKEDAVVVEHTRRSRMRIRARPRVMTDAEKLACGRYKVCEYCDKIISKRWLGSHVEQTEYCKIARDAKRLAISTKKIHNTEKVEAIAKIKRALWKKRNPHLWREFSHQEPED